MDDLGKAFLGFFALAAYQVVVVLVCLAGVIIVFIKRPRESARLLLSFLLGTLIVSVVGYFTKSLWFDLGSKTESSIIGLFISLALVVVFTYLFNRYLVSKGK